MLTHPDIQAQVNVPTWIGLALTLKHLMQKQR